MYKKIYEMNELKEDYHTNILIRKILCLAIQKKIDSRNFFKRIKIYSFKHIEVDINPVQINKIRVNIQLVVSVHNIQNPIPKEMTILRITIMPINTNISLKEVISKLLETDSNQTIIEILKLIEM